MSASIFGVLKRSSASAEDIRRIISTPPVSTGKYTYDGDALYDALCRGFSWLDPPPESDSVLVWSQDYPELHPVTMPDGRKALLFILYYDDGDPDGPIDALLLEGSL